MRNEERVAQALKLCGEIVEVLDVVSDIEAGRPFFTAVEVKTQGIKGWVMTRNAATERQVFALENMLRGVNRWKERINGRDD